MEITSEILDSVLTQERCLVFFSPVYGQETAMPTLFSKKQTFPLTADDKSRLQKLAPLFDIHFCKIDENTCILTTMAGAGALEVELPASLAYRRLLSEICEQTVHWIHFHFDESCRDSLLGRNDANLALVAELYARDRNDARINLGKK